MRRIVLANDVLLPEARQLLSDGESVVLKVKGESMLPFIVDDRDSVTLCKAGTVNKGDIALAQLADGRYVLHRVIDIEGERVKLMGDGNLGGTEECPKRDIAGIAVRILRNGRYVDCASETERRKAKLWGLLKPIRRYLLAIYKQIK